MNNRQLYKYARAIVKMVENGCPAKDAVWDTSNNVDDFCYLYAKYYYENEKAKKDEFKRKTKEGVGN